MRVDLVGTSVPDAALSERETPESGYVRRKGVLTKHVEGDVSLLVCEGDLHLAVTQIRRHAVSHRLFEVSQLVGAEHPKKREGGATLSGASAMYSSTVDASLRIGENSTSARSAPRDAA